jgi:hypothetical protein
VSCLHLLSLSSVSVVTYMCSTRFVGGAVCKQTFLVKELALRNGKPIYLFLIVTATHKDQDCGYTSHYCGLSYSETLWSTG